VNSDGEFANDRRWVVTNKDGPVLMDNGGVLNVGQSDAASLATARLPTARLLRELLRGWE
jgi:hypothetical protein